MSRVALAALLAIVLLAGALYWMSLSVRRAPASNADSAPSVTDSAVPQTHPQQTMPDKPSTEPENSFIVCPGNPRCP